jgi:hypothetical protein
VLGVESGESGVAWHLGACLMATEISAWAGRVGHRGMTSSNSPMGRGWRVLCTGCVSEASWWRVPQYALGDGDMAMGRLQPATPTVSGVTLTSQGIGHLIIEAPPVPCETVPASVLASASASASEAAAAVRAKFAGTIQFSSPLGCPCRSVSGNCPSRNRRRKERCRRRCMGDEAVMCTKVSIGVWDRSQSLKPKLIGAEQGGQSAERTVHSANKHTAHTH